MFALILNDTVIQVSKEQFATHPSLSFVIIPDGLEVATGWKYDNKVFTPPILPQPSEEEQYNTERAAVDFKYSAPWNGETGGILTLLQMTVTAALCEVPQNAEKIANIGTQYQTELTAMNNEFQAIDEKYGVA